MNSSPSRNYVLARTETMNYLIQREARDDYRMMLKQHSSWDSPELAESSSGSTTSVTAESMDDLLNLHRHTAFNSSSMEKIDSVSETDQERGVWVRLHSDTHTVTVEHETGVSLRKIHPNCNAPASLKDVRKLCGGGSGTAVFHAVHEDAGPLVLKHGGPKDTLEVFALADIAMELEKRSTVVGGCNGSDTEECFARQNAADYMQTRIPEFVGVFVSPYHVRDRAQELWNTIRDPSALHDMKLTQSQLKTSGRTTSGSDDDDEDDDEAFEGDKDHFDQFVGASRNISVRRGDTVGLEVLFRSVVLYIPTKNDDGSTMEGGPEILRDLADQLAEEQIINNWKVTLMQKMIGGPNSTNGAKVLTGGLLEGDLLSRIKKEFTKIILQLQVLTWPHEKRGVESAKEEYRSLAETKNVALITKETDMFCGCAIRKNFHPLLGRFPKLRKFGLSFRQCNLMLTKKERFPAWFLGLLLKPNVSFDDIFSQPCPLRSALDLLENSWLEILQLATSLDGQATDRIWTCGLTDAGLHNTLVSETRGLELFDLGQAQLMPPPAFLTKFLFSFFHAFGMEETENVDKNKTAWIRRFEVTRGKLSLTKDTQDLLPFIYDSFKRTVDHFVVNLFENDQRVRTLLVKYVVLQLLSDCAFCLLRWEQKGGGRERFGKRASANLQQWLWRSLWDLYIASDVYEKLLVA